MWPCPSARNLTLKRRPSELEHPVVAFGHWQARSCMVCPASGGASWSHLARHFCVDAAGGLSPGEREGLSRDEAHRRTFGGRRVHAARDVFRSAAVSTRDRRPGAADHLRQPRQPDAGPDDRARARHGRAAGHRRGTVAADPAGAGGEPAAVDCRGSGRSSAGSGLESRAGGVSGYLSRLQAGLASLCLSAGDLACSHVCSSGWLRRCGLPVRLRVRP